MFLRNVGIYLQVCTALQPKIPTSTNHIVDCGIYDELQSLFFYFSPSVLYLLICFCLNCISDSNELSTRFRQ
jgi:hypothetical protein